MDKYEWPCTEEHIQEVNKYMKILSTSLVTREIQQVLVLYPADWQKFKSLTIASVGEIL